MSCIHTSGCGIAYTRVCWLWDCMHVLFVLYTHVCWTLGIACIHPCLFGHWPVCEWDLGVLASGRRSDDGGRQPLFVTPTMQLVPLFCLSRRSDKEGERQPLPILYCGLLHHAAFWFACAIIWSCSQVRHKALSSANVPLHHLADGSTQLHCLQILAVLWRHKDMTQTFREHVYLW